MPEDLHEWVSFDDPDEDRTWVFDVTFLTSPWTCIFGRGCQGVLTGPAEELEQGCCSYGAHFVDEDDEATMLAYAERLTRRAVAVPRRGPAQGRHRRSATRRVRSRPGSSTAPASSSTAPASRAASGARSTRARSTPASDRSTGSPTCAGSSRCASRTRPTTTATSPRPCGSGSDATGARAASSSTGGAPTTPRPSSTGSPSTTTMRDEIVEMVGQHRLRPARRSTSAREAARRSTFPILRCDAGDGPTRAGRST